MTDLRILLPELILSALALVLIVVARRVKRARWSATAVVTTAIAAAFSSWAFGSGAPAIGFGGTVAADAYAQFFHVLFAANLALAALFSMRLVEAEHAPPAEYYALLLLASTGMMLSASAIDLLVLYLGLELMTLCSYILVGIRRDLPVANEAAVKYFLLGSFASALLLYGIALVYGVTGAAWRTIPSCSQAWRWWRAGWPSRSPQCRSTPGRRTCIKAQAPRSPRSWPPARRPRALPRCCECR
jgi:NADH-quinone oxidoreductase subunit N